MKEDNLIQIWKEAHIGMKKETVDIERLLRERHCKILLRTERKLKKWTWLLSIALVINLGINIFVYYVTEDIIYDDWAFFLWSIMLFSNISRRRMLKTAVTAHSIKQSRIELKKKMKRNMWIDFIGFLILFNTTAIYLAIEYFLEYQPPFDFFDVFEIGCILLMMSVPWIVRLQQKWKYQSLFRTLDKDIRILEEKENISIFGAQ